MILPRGDEYNVAVQNPRVAFTDSDLKISTVETDPLGLPKPYSGGFTITYKLSNHQKGWAVRCFHRDIQDLQKRYQAVGSFLSKNSLKFFVEAKYLSDGIRVNGQGYPVIKMAWLEGNTLDNYLEKVHSQKIKVENILSEFVSLVSELERFGIAHGDLQHGNIIVQNEKLYLIDYDGMYFPELSSLRTNEIGHINYQHPKRSAADYNQHIDRFSAIIIYIGLKGISLNPSLWKKYGYNDNILFRSKDFSDLHNSPVIQELSAIQELKPLVERLIGCCYLEFGKIPSLKDFLSGNFNYNKSAVGTISITRTQYEILDGNNSGSILEHFGEKVEVIGRIGAIKSSTTKYGDPYTFLNFGSSWPNHTFTIVMWQQGIAALKTKGITPSSLVGKWVSITGVIASYGNKPQAVVELATQIQILGGEVEANQRLKLKSSNPSTLSHPKTPRTTDREADVFNEIYKNRSTSVPSKPVNIPPTYKQMAPKYTPPSSTNQSTSTKSDSNNAGCVVAIIGALIGAIVIGAASNGKLWLVGAFGGGFLGLWIVSWFKS